MTTAYDSLLASETPAFAVLAEVQPMEPLGVWTKEGAFFFVYSCSFSTQIATSIIAGGLYRRLDSVKQDGTALTLRASAALCDANPGSYYYDSAASKLYVATTTHASPETFSLIGAWFTLFFASTSVSFSDQPLYLPIIAGNLPKVSSTMPDTLFGAQQAPEGNLTLSNADGLFDRLSRLYVWQNKKVTIKLGGVGLAYSDFGIVASMRINSFYVDDELAVFGLEDFSNILNRTLPLLTWGDGTLGSSTPDPGVVGEYQPLVFGKVTDAPYVLGGTDTWYGFDATNQTITLYEVVAVNRTTNVRTVLGFGVDYTTGGGGATILILNPTYNSTDYAIRATIGEVVTDAVPTFGTMAKHLLSLCGEDSANIDSTAFAQADTDAPQVLYRLVTQPILAADLLRELEQSVNGQVYRGPDGRWTCRILTPSAPSSYVSLSDADFAQWESVKDDLPVTVLNEVRVRYAHQPATDDWTEVSASSDAVRYGQETRDSHRIDTWLRDASDARVLADRLRWLRSTAQGHLTFEERGLTLMQSSVGDLVSVTRARAPERRTGQYSGHFLRILSLEKGLGPDAPIVSGVLGDLDGRTDLIFRLATAGSTLTWSSASAAEKALYGFLSDTNRYIDATDPLTKDGKALY